MRNARMAIVLAMSANMSYAATASLPWSYRDGVEGDPLCRHILTRLNRFATGPNHDQCAFGVIASSPELMSPHWQSLDGAKHLELIAKLLRYQDQLERSEVKDPGVSIASDEDLSNARKFLANGGSIQVTYQQLSGLYRVQPAPAGRQAVVRLQLGFIKQAPISPCGHGARLTWEGPIFVVRSDLSGPDTAIDPARANALLGTSLMFYKGLPVFVTDEDVTTMTGVNGVGSVCRLIYQR